MENFNFFRVIRPWHSFYLRFSVLISDLLKSLLRLSSYDIFGILVIYTTKLTLKRINELSDSCISQSKLQSQVPCRFDLVYSLCSGSLKKYVTKVLVLIKKLLKYQI